MAGKKWGSIGSKSSSLSSSSPSRSYSSAQDKWSARDNRGIAKAIVGSIRSRQSTTPLYDRNPSPFVSPTAQLQQQQAARITGSGTWGGRTAHASAPVRDAPRTNYDPNSSTIGWNPGAANGQLPAVQASERLFNQQDVGAGRIQRMPSRSEQEAEVFDPWDVRTRELTQSEFERLTPAQQRAVRLNTSLLTAHAADSEEGTNTRTQQILGRLGLAQDYADGISQGDVLPLTRYGDLFSGGGDLLPSPQGPTTSDGRTPVIAGNSPLTQERRRQQLINSIAANVEAVLANNPSADASSMEQAAAAESQNFNFASDQAAGDYSYTFDQLLDPTQLQNIPWPEASRYLRESGYDPSDFRSYALNRITMYPQIEGRTSIEDLRRWFGED